MAQLDELLDFNEEEPDLDKPGSGDGDTGKLDRPSDNKAVARCIHAWRYAYNKKRAELDEDESQYPAEKAACQAYLRAMPPPLVTKTSANSSLASRTPSSSRPSGPGMPSSIWRPPRSLSAPSTTSQSRQLRSQNATTASRNLPRQEESK